MTDWDAAYRAGETPWDKGMPSPALVADLARQAIVGRVLVPGCGRGNDFPALLAGGATDVVGLDIAVTAVVEARTRFADNPAVRVEHGDLFSLPKPWHGTFDVIFEHTCFCAIPRDKRPDYVNSVAHALRPGGLLLAVFYINPRDDPDPTLGPPFGSEPSELAERFEPWFEVEESGPARDAFPERTGREQVWRLRRRPMCAL